MYQLKRGLSIGLDTCYSIMEVLHRETGDTKYRPSVLLGRMVDAGWMGKKTGKGDISIPNHHDLKIDCAVSGFYDYSKM